METDKVVDQEEGQQEFSQTTVRSDVSPPMDTGVTLNVGKSGRVTEQEVNLERVSDENVSPGRVSDQGVIHERVSDENVSPGRVSDQGVIHESDEKISPGRASDQEVIHKRASDDNFSPGSISDQHIAEHVIQDATKRTESEIIHFAPGETHDEAMNMMLTGDDSQSTQSIPSFKNDTQTASALYNTNKKCQNEAEESDSSGTPSTPNSKPENENSCTLNENDVLSSSTVSDNSNIQNIVFESRNQIDHNKLESCSGQESAKVCDKQSGDQIIDSENANSNQKVEDQDPLEEVDNGVERMYSENAGSVEDQDPLEEVDNGAESMFHVGGDQNEREEVELNKEGQESPKVCDFPKTINSLKQSGDQIIDNENAGSNQKVEDQIPVEVDNRAESTFPVSGNQNETEEVELNKEGNQQVIQVNITWKNGTGDQGASKCIKWHMITCSFCENALDRWQDHVMNQHHEGYSSFSVCDDSNQYDEQSQPPSEEMGMLVLGQRSDAGLRVMKSVKMVDEWTPCEDVATDSEVTSNYAGRSKCSKESATAEELSSMNDKGSLSVNNGKVRNSHDQEGIEDGQDVDILSVNNRRVERKLKISMKWNRPDSKSSMYMYQCRSPFCSRSFFRKSSLLHHEKNEHDTIVFECSHCKKQFKHNSAYHRHMLVHTEPQQCRLCRKMYKNKSALLRHQMSNHSEVLRKKKRKRESGSDGNDMSCESAEQVGNKGALVIDLNEDKKGKALNNVDLKRDRPLGMKKRGKNKKHNWHCKECGKTFHARSHMQRHQLTHTKEQACQLCWKVYKNMQGLLRHLRLAHSDELVVEDTIKNRGGLQNRANYGDDIVEVPDEPCVVKIEKLPTDVLDIKMEEFQDVNSEQTTDSFKRDIDFVVQKSRLYSQELMDLNEDERRQVVNQTARDIKEECYEDKEDEDDLEEDDYVPTEEEEEYIPSSRKSKRKKCKKGLYQCTECNKQFQYKSHFVIHSLTHSEGKICDICNKECKNELSLQRHKKLAHEQDESNLKYPCRSGDCDKSFLSPKDRNHHEKEAHEDLKIDLYKCESCDKSFPFKSHYERHQLIHSDDKVCDICDTVCKNELSLLRHKKTVHEGKVAAKDVPLRYPCRSNHCNESFPFLKDRIQHEKEAHDGAALQCQVCLKHFHTKSHYNRHLQTHTESQKCDICKKICKNLLTLEKHKRLHMQKMLVCQFCGKTFHERGRLNEHESLHVNGKQFQCKVCGKCLVNKASLESHMQHHIGYKFICMHCGKGCQTKLFLKEHEAIHTGEKPHICSECGESFRTSQQIFNHKLRHQEMRFNCDICSKKFRWKCDLNVHKQVHMGLREHKCDMCDKSFNNYSNMRAHKKQVHLGIKRTGHGKNRTRRTLLHRPLSDARRVPTARIIDASKIIPDRYDDETVITSTEAQSSPSKRLLHRPYNDTFAANSSESQASTSAAMYHPSLRTYHSSAVERAPHQQEPSGNRGYQYSIIRPDHNEFYSMVDTLLQFSKDN